SVLPPMCFFLLYHGASTQLSPLPLLDALPIYGVEGDQGADGRVVGVDQQPRHDGEDDDAVAQGQPVAAGVELAREVAALREDGAEDGKTVEGGVGREEQDQRGHDGDQREPGLEVAEQDRKSTRLNSSHVKISYAVFCLKK